MRLKEEQRREKEAARQKAANDRLLLAELPKNPWKLLRMKGWS